MIDRQASKHSPDAANALTRQDFGWSMRIASRWADCDPYGHVNNAIYYAWIDTAITTLAIQRGLLRAPGQTSIGLCVASACQFLRPIGFPETVDACVRIAKVGQKSLNYEVALFAIDAISPSAMADFTHVYVDHRTRKSVPLTSEQKEAARGLFVGASADERS